MDLDRLLGRKRRRTHASVRVAGGVAGIATGVGLMYLLDPRGGPRRRSQIAQRAERVLHEVEGSIGAGARDLSHRARGLAHEAKVRVEGEEVSDDVLAERVRAKLGRLTAHPRAIEVAVRDGRVELSGPVFRAEHDQVVRGVRWVRGVRRVEDRLQPREGADVRALQGAGPLTSARVAPLSAGAFGPGARLLAGAAGAVLAARALLGSGATGILAGVAGAAILGKTIGDYGPARRGARRVARETGARAHREGEERAEREEHRGAWHPGPEVREVKSPAELEPGVASASPTPTFPSRVDRGERDRSNRGKPGWKGAAEDEAPPAGTGSEDVSPRTGYVAPPAGSEVREADLGSVGSTRDDQGAERGGEGAARRDPTDEG
jgi:osmotically-inducible protein OsmY